MRSEDRKPSKRVFPLLQNLDLDTVTFEQIQGVGDSITIEDMNEQELQDLVLVNLARLCVSSEWDGLLEAGGGNEFNGELVSSAANGSTFFHITSGPPWGTGTTQGLVFNNAEVYYYPFLSPVSSTLDELKLYISVASTTANLLVGIYSDDDGVPDSLLGYVTLDVTSTGYISSTSWTGGPPDLVRGTQYWISWVRDAAESLAYYSQKMNQATGLGVSPGPTSVGYTYLDVAHSLSLPATVAASDLESSATVMVPDLGVKFD
jgi:hypothetical protein